VTLADPEGAGAGLLWIAGVQVRRAPPGFATLALPRVDAWDSTPALFVSHFPVLSRAGLFAHHGWKSPGDRAPVFSGPSEHWHFEHGAWTSVA
jgi:hypothetical protein